MTRSRLSLGRDNFSSKLYAIDGREVAPKSAGPDLFTDKNSKAIKFYPDAVINGKSVGVPGLIKLMEETHKKFGRLKWEELFIEPIKIAEEGFSVSPALHILCSICAILKQLNQHHLYIFKRIT